MCSILDLLFIFLFFNYVDSGNQCFPNEMDTIDQHLGTKTPYRTILNRNDSIIHYDECQPKKIWSIIRHGTRYPSRKIIRKIKSRLVEVRDLIVHQKNELCDEDREQLRLWTFDVDEKERSFLTYEGVDELLNLGERMQNRFPDIIPDIYDNNTFKFKFTNTQRARKSFEGFATGLFGRQNIKQIWYPEPEDKDPVLRFYKLCNKWINEVDHNDTAAAEKDLWFNGPQMREVLNNISLKINVPSLTLYDIHLMYTVCAFESAWNKFQPSPWCNFFDIKSIQVLEYLEDLKYYWIDGYGYKLTSDQAYVTIADMIKHIEAPAGPKAVFYFTHSGTMLKILAYLGLYKDEFPLNHKELNVNRKWKVSKIDAFATNIAFVLFQCSSGPHLLLMHQEQIVRLPFCDKSDLCHLDIFKSNFNESISKCRFNEMCENKILKSEINN